MGTKGTNLTDVKAHNLKEIKRMIYFYAPVTRQKIAEELGLTLPTITTNVSSMLEEGLLVEFEARDRAASPLGGRPSALIDFRPKNILGIELGPYKTLFCLTDLRGKTIYNKAFDPVSQDYESMLRFISERIIAFGREAIFDQNKTPGIGIGLPGIIDSSTGIVHSSIYASWNGKPLAQDISERIGLPVFIDNNVRLRALGHELFSKNEAVGIFAYLYVSRGIACQLIIKNNLLDGNISGAGEIGHTTILPDGPICPVCGRQGCLESVSGEGAIVNSVLKAIKRGEATKLTELVGQGELLTIDHILKAQENGDKTVGAIIYKAVKYLGLSVANIFNFIGPDIIAVDGYIFKNKQNRIFLQETVNKNLYGLTNSKAKIDFLSYDQYYGAKGAAAIVICRQILN